MKDAAKSLAVCGSPADGWLRMPAFVVLDHALHFVSRHEAHELHAILVSGRVPFDLERKLESLAGGGIQNHSIAQHSRLLLALLLAAYEGAFAAVKPHERERLLHALAYVRKDDDVIPDYTTGGYTDDYQVIRAIDAEFAPLLHAFKLWRLRSQVPGMWTSHPAPLLLRPSGSGSCRTIHAVSQGRHTHGSAAR